MDISVGKTRRHGAAAVIAVEAVKMSVDSFQLIKIVLVGMLIARRAIGITGVIHAATEVRVVEVLILMVETEVMSNFLAHDKPPPLGGVVCGRVKISVIHLGSGLRNMTAAYPYLRNTEPAIVAVFGIADLDPPTCRATPSACGGAGHLGEVEDGGRVPITDGFIQI